MKRKIARKKTVPAAVEDLARAHASAAVAALATVMQDETATPAARISAASAILQWGFGRPTALTKTKGGEGGEQVVQLSWGEG